MSFQEKDLKVQGRDRRKSQTISPGHWHLVATRVGYTPVCKPKTVDLCLSIGNNEIQSFVLSVLTLFGNAKET